MGRKGEISDCCSATRSLMSGEIVVGRSKTFSEFFLKVGLVVGKLLFLPPVLFRTGGGLFGYLCKLLAIFAPSKNE